MRALLFPAPSIPLKNADSFEVGLDFVKHLRACLKKFVIPRVLLVPSILLVRNLKAVCAVASFQSKEMEIVPSSLCAENEYEKHEKHENTHSLGFHS
jgi:hypothetical protein